MAGFSEPDSMTLIAIAILSSIQIVPVSVPCGSVATFTGRYSGELSALGEVRLEALDVDGTVIASAWVTESYQPPDAEQVQLVLGSDTRWLRCSALGPSLLRLGDGQLDVSLERPVLEVVLSDDRTTLTLSWPDLGHCWRPQRLTALGWVDCERVEAVTGGTGFFRLAN